MVLALVVVLGGLTSGCALVGAGIGVAISEGEADKLSGIVEVGEVKMKASANIAILKAVKLSSAVFEKDMMTRNVSPNPTDIKVHAAVTEEIKRSLGALGESTSSVVARLKTTYHNSYPGTSWYYLDVTEKNTLAFLQTGGVRKLVNTHFVLEQGSDTLLEVHGLWVSGNQGDEIAGARQLAKEMVSEVMKKLSVTSAPPRESVAEAETKKE